MDNNRNNIKKPASKNFNIPTKANQEFSSELDNTNKKSQQNKSAEKVSSSSDSNSKNR